MTSMAAEAPGLERYVGGTIAGRYRIDRLLGEGGMGAVLQAHHLGLRRDVAVKLLHPEVSRDPQVSGRFDREAQSASRLDHPNCIRVTDFGTWEPPDGGLPVKFMVMQLLEGRELADLLGSPMPPVRALELMVQVLDGLAHAHEHGIIHRDIKPENIFVTTDHAGRENLKLVDFGIAKVMSGEGSQDQMTKAGLVFGTPRYMSPEQAAGGKINERTDLYACGIILYQMLAGRTPFDGDDLVGLLRQQILAHPPPLPPSIDPELADAVYRLLAKKADDRFASAIETRDVLAGIKRRLSTEGASASFSSASIGEDATIAPGDGLAISATNVGTYPSPVASGSFPSPGTVAAMPAPTPMPFVRSGATYRPTRLGLPLRTWAMIGGGVVAFVAILALARGGDSNADGASATTDPAAAVAGKPDTKSPPTPQDVAAAIVGALPVPAAPAEDLAEIDRRILAEEWAAAGKLIDPLLDAYPQDAQLLWRKGALAARTKNGGAQALAWYAKAVAQDASLLDDRRFMPELDRLLRRRDLRDAALDLAVQHLGEHGHAFLLELVSAQDDVLGYVDRHRALDVLDGDAELRARVDLKLHHALDLWQASESPKPCATFGEALDEIEDAPDAYYLGTLEQVAVPDPKKVKDGADASACTELEKRRAEVRDAHRAKFGDATRTVPAAYAKGTKKRRKSDAAGQSDEGGGSNRPGRRFLRRLGL
jgi:serine/threonine protein kinase